MEHSAWIQDPVSVAATLLGVLALLFQFGSTEVGKKIFGYVPLLIFAYFVPTVLSNLGIIPVKSEVYTFISRWILPASLLLLTISVDLPAIFRLGPKALTMFFAATASIVLGGPIAVLLFGFMAPEALGDQFWKGLAALSGSWIGGGANFVAIGKSVQALDSTIALMVIVDVVVANLWMAVLLYYAGREEAMDKSLGADRTALDELKEKIETFQKAQARPTNLPELMTIVAIGFGGTAVAKAIAVYLPDIGQIVTGFTWVVILVSSLGVALSFTKARKLEGAGASVVGSVLLYLLVASIGAKGEFYRVVEAPALVWIGLVWMAIHAITMIVVRRMIKAPIFLLAVGSQANIGAAASAPVVASAFHPALAPVGVLLAVFGYVLGTYAGLLCAWLLSLTAGVWGI